MIAEDSLRVSAWWRCLLLGFWVSIGVHGQPADKELIQAAGHAEVYFLSEGTKHYIETPAWIVKNGFASTTVHVLTPAELAAIPTSYSLTESSPLPGTPRAMEGLMLLGPDGKVYVVKNGERHWIRNGQWIAESRYAGQAPTPATQAEVEWLQLGGDYTYAPRYTNPAIFLAAIALFAFLSVCSSRRADAFIQKRNTWQARTVLVAIFAVVIGLREPYLLEHPRFWAEEGFFWFQYAVSHSVIRSLFFIHPLSSYFNLTINVGAVLSALVASRFGLEYAPLVTTWLAFLIQVLAIGVILFCKSRLFNSPWKAVVGCLIVLFAPTTTDEIWLNMTSSMSFLGLISLVLLFAETRDWAPWVRWGTRALLLVCGLSSPYSAALLPLFLILAWRSRERELKIQSLVLAVCVMVQIGCVATTRMDLSRTGRSPVRGADVRLDTSAVNVLSAQMIFPALGSTARETLLAKLGLKEAWISASSFPPRPFTDSLRPAGWFCLILIALVLAMLRGPTLFSIPNILIAAFLSLAVFTCVTSLYSVPTGRYAFLPAVAFLLLLLADTESPNSWIRRLACMAVLSFGLANGMVAYRTPEFQDGPSWSKEVQLWRADPSHPLRVWPSFFHPDSGIIYKK